MDKSNSMQIMLSLGVIATGVAVAIGVMYNKKRENKKREIESENLKTEIQSKIENELESTRKNLFDNATRYYIEIYYRQYDISDDKIKELHHDYPQVLAKPFIDWTKYDISAKRYNPIQEILQKRVDNNSLELYHLKEAYESSILKEAEEKARDILEHSRS